MVCVTIKSDSYHFFLNLGITYASASTDKPVTVVSKAIFNGYARVDISIEPNAAKPGPNGINVPEIPMIRPTLQ